MVLGNGTKLVHEMSKVKQRNGIKRSPSGFYSFRKQVPEKLRKLWGKREVKVKLETKDEVTALSRGAVLLAVFNKKKAKLTKLLDSPESLSSQEVIQIADQRIRSWDIHPDQAPVLRAGASEEEFTAFKAAEAEYLELRELYFNDASDILIDEEQRSEDYKNGRWVQSGYQTPYRKPDLGKVEEAALMIAAGDITTTKEPTLSDAVSYYLTDYRERNIDGNSRTIQTQTANTRRVLREFAAHIENGRASAGWNRLVTSVTVEEALTFRSYLRSKHPQSSTADSYLRYPSAVFQHAIDRGQGLYVDGHIMRNPFFKLRNKKLETKYSKKRWPLTPDEFELYRKAAYQEPEQIKLLVLFMLFTGCRVSDASGLEVQDINLTENIPTMYLRHNQIRRLDKGGLEANIPLIGELLDELRKYAPPSNPTDPYLPQFGSLKSYRDRASQEANRVLRKAGVVRSGVSSHSARHTWQDRLDAARVAIAERDYLLAHKTTQSSAVAAGYGSFYPPQNMLHNQLAALNCTEWGDFRSLARDS